MKLYISTSVTTTQVESDKELDIDLSKLNEDSQDRLLNELIDAMHEEDISFMLSNNDKMIIALCKEHVHIEDSKIRNMVFALYSDMDSKILSKELMSIINKHKIEL